MLKYLFGHHTPFQSRPRSKWNQRETIIIAKFCHQTNLLSVGGPYYEISWMTLVMRFIFSVLFPHNHCRGHIVFSNYGFKSSFYFVINWWIVNLYTSYMKQRINKRKTYLPPSPHKKNRSPAYINPKLCRSLSINHRQALTAKSLSCKFKTEIRTLLHST